MKGKVATIVILLATFILAGVAIFTAIRIYQLRQTSISPIAPSSKPAAQETTQCSLTFTLGETPTASPTSSPTASPTGSPSPTPVPQCDESCTASSECPSNLTCSIAPGETTGTCRNPSCSGNSDCICTTPTPTSTPTSSPGAPNSCNGTCGSNDNCQGSYLCYQGFCRNPSCTSDLSCNCDGVSTPGPSQAPGEPAQPELPQSGIDWPTYTGVGLGIFVILASILLAL